MSGNTLRSDKVIELRKDQDESFKQITGVVAAASSIKPRVLAFCEDAWALQQLRIRQPFDSLVRQGLIEGYTIVLGDKLIGPNTFTHYDVVWIQRNPASRLYQAISEIADKIIVDVDDLIPATPSYRDGQLPGTEDLFEAFSNGAIPALTSRRLAELYSEYLELPISDNCNFAPNCFPFPNDPPADPTKPQGLLWTSSDIAALVGSGPAVLNAIRDFSEKYDLPIYAAGVFSEEHRGFFKHLVELGKMDFWQHKEMLATLPTMIAVCPLETVADKETLDFISGKSDLKKVEFAGFGHPGVYSKSPPYVDTDLDVGICVENTYEEWMTALEYQYEKGYQSAKEEAQHVRDLRNVDRVAREDWFPIIQKGFLDQSITMQDFYLTLRKHDLRRLATLQGASFSHVESEDLMPLILKRGDQLPEAFDLALAELPQSVPMRFRMVDGFYRRFIKPLPRPIAWLLGYVATHRYRPPRID